MNLNEAFKALDSLNEDIFDMSDNGLSGLSDFMNDDIESEDVQIIDPEATTEDELSDSYVGKVILDCSVCHSKIYKSKDEVTLDEEGVLANVGEDCPYCYTSDGFKVVGEVVPFNGEGDSDDGETPADGEELPADDDVDEGLLAGDVNVNLDARGFGGSGNDVSVLGSGLPESKEDKLKEGIQDLSMTTNDTHFEVSEDDSGTVTVTASPATADGGEQIAPVSDELEGEITSASEGGEDATGEDGAGEEDSIDIAIDEVDEGSLDELGEAYLTNVYGNVKSFKTSRVSTCGNKFIVEGRITFKSGKTGNTSFILESHSADKKGRVTFVGGNKHFSNSNKAYTLNGKVSNNKFIAESLRYNYRTQDKVGVRGKVTKRVK